MASRVRPSSRRSICRATWVVLRPSRSACKPLDRWDRRVRKEGWPMGSPGWKAKVKRSGTSTTFTDEPASLVSDTTYQIDDETKQVWDRSAPVVVKDDGNEVDPDDIDHIDYLYGKATFIGGYTPE